MFVIERVDPKVINLTVMGKAMPGNPKIEVKSLKEYLGVKVYNGKSVTDEELMAIVNRAGKIKVTKKIIPVVKPKPKAKGK